MKLDFYPRIALTSIKSNKKLYYPYLMTCVMIVMMFYIMCYVTSSKTISQLTAGQQLQLITSLGCFVIGFFAVLFLFYTNSFLSKRRQKEFGLYQILGMSKGNIAIVLFFEYVFVLVASLVLGLFFGILLSKFAESILVRMAAGIVNYQFEISEVSAISTILLFVFCFLMMYVFNTISINLSKPIDLVNGQLDSDTAPKANWLLAIFGIVLLAYAYYLAIRVQNTIGALAVFFAAVIMVIIASYCLFIAFSVALCKLLQTNKKFYYQTTHFISVSNMGFRMKRNGASLATICILSTMVLVMISSTSALYFSTEDALETSNKYDCIVKTTFTNYDQLSADNISLIERLIEDSNENGIVIMKDKCVFQALTISGIIQKETLITNPNDQSDYTFITSDIVQINIFSTSDYERLTGKKIKLADNQGLFINNDTNYQGETISFDGEKTYDLLYEKESFYQGTIDLVSSFKSACLIVNDYDNLASILFPNGGNAKFFYCFNTDSTLENQSDYLSLVVKNLKESEADFYLYNTDCKESYRMDVYSSFGGLFFIGIIISITFIVATALIIYYKQTIEGYEDEKKYQIMKNVGMSDKDIKSTIHYQMLIVFFSPLIMAVIHLMFALPMIHYLLKAFNFVNIRPLIFSSIICVLVYCFVYLMVFKATSNVYYGIVSSNDR